METRTHIRFRSARVNFKEGREERKKASVSQPIEARINFRTTNDRSIDPEERKGRKIPPSPGSNKASKIRNRRGSMPRWTVSPTTRTTLSSHRSFRIVLSLFPLSLRRSVPRRCVTALSSLLLSSSLAHRERIRYPTLEAGIPDVFFSSSSSSCSIHQKLINRIH